MKFKAIKEGKLFRPAWGAVLVVLCGIILWRTPLGEPWVNASYDYTFRFGARSVTNKVVLIRMDNSAYHDLDQSRDRPWDRGLHARLLNRLAQDQCPLVVFDSFFRGPGVDNVKDESLMDAMRRMPRVVLMAELARVTDERTTSVSAHAAQPTLPWTNMLQAAGGNSGVAWLDPDLDGIVRRHWPFPSPGSAFSSLPETAARQAGASLDDQSRERWLRYYGRDGAWTSLSYQLASMQAPNYFRDRVVFIGNHPENTLPGNERDEFSTPYTRWTGESAGGVDIMITEFLNLLNRDWLERPAWWIEGAIVIGTGALLGASLGRLRPMTAVLTAAAAASATMVGAVSTSHFTHYWFPWLVIAGGQVPCALVWAILMPTIRRVHETITETGSASPQLIPAAPVPQTTGTEIPDIPDYELVNPPFGEGAYGKVWLARNAIGQWQALKVVYLANFENNPDPYDREFNGISRYKPVSEKHPGLLRIDFVSKKRAGYFYYVMELGDPLDPDWEKEPSTYKPRDLTSVRARSRGKRLPVRECVRIGLVLTDALAFLHKQGLTHRDIKPQNIIFVDGQPKLADVGLTAQIRPTDKERTFVGTPGYMPPLPERPGTPQADIYALGMVLYVLSTGRNAAYFPEIATTLVDSPDPADFFPLNTVILKACHPDSAHRYASAEEMRQALLDAQKALGSAPEAEALGRGDPPS